MYNVIMTKRSPQSWIKVQVYGTVGISIALAVTVGALELYETLAPSSFSTTNIINLGNGGMTGVFVVWLVFVLLFSLVNFLVYLARR